MAAHGALGAGEAPELHLDHEPECLYHTLLATRGDDAFDMEYLEAGTRGVASARAQAPAAPEVTALQEKRCELPR